MYLSIYLSIYAYQHEYNINSTLMQTMTHPFIQLVRQRHWPLLSSSSLTDCRPSIGGWVEGKRRKVDRENDR